jgi:hypothetical protein
MTQGLLLLLLLLLPLLLPPLLPPPADAACLAPASLLPRSCPSAAGDRDGLTCGRAKCEPRRSRRLIGRGGALQQW